MNILIVATALIAVSAGGAVPLIPGDNSGYVEGVSRYIWMANGDDVPQLVDLQAPLDYAALSRDGVNNQYLLYTRENVNSYQSLVHGDMDSVINSNYNPNRPTKLIVHGWNNDFSSDINTYIMHAFLDTDDCNVIILDWSELASSNYISAALGAISVGEYAGDFLLWLFSTTGGNWNDLHLIGHSLGAHAAGVAGRRIGGVARRVTGLDPAGPLWIGHSEALSTASGIYVEAIHTDGGVLGIYHSVGHADFYPNGGTNPQPGCLTSICSHGLSYFLFAASIRYNHFVANECESMVEVLLNTCSGATYNMGNGIMTKSGTGIYRVETSDVWPY